MREDKGRTRIDVDYSFPDVIAAEILVGFAEDSEEFYSTLGNAMQKTSDLIAVFMTNSEPLISYHLKHWGFQKK